MLMNCGDAVMSRPSVGSWVTYGLGTQNQNLPGFISMCPGGYPIKEAENWQSGFLPGVYQGTYIDSQHTKIEKLIEHIRNNYTSLKEQREQLDLLHQLNEEHQQRRQQDARLEARIQSFELAYRMQIEAADAFDISQEPQPFASCTAPARTPGRPSSRADCSKGASVLSSSGMVPDSLGTTTMTSSNMRNWPRKLTNRWLP
jgi:hypothetical protein